MPRAGDVAALELLACAHIEQIQRSASLLLPFVERLGGRELDSEARCNPLRRGERSRLSLLGRRFGDARRAALALEAGEVPARSEEHTSELQSLRHLVCRLLLEKK